MGFGKLLQWIGRAGLIGGLVSCLIWANPATAEQVELSPAQAKALARDRLPTNPSLAAGLAQALLQHIPNDVEALLLLAAAQISLGHYDDAAQNAQRAFALAPRGPIRVNAARLAASAHQRAGHHTRAELWLRRGLNNVTDANEQRALHQDFAAVRQANPLSANINFSLAPNSNINNGSNAEFIYIWNIPFQLSADARALSGFELAGSADLKYRLSESETHATQIGLNLFGRTFELSDASAAAAPNTSGSDYAFAQAELSFDHTRKFAALSGPSQITLSLGQNWYGGEPYTRYQRLTLSQDFQLSNTTGLQLSAHNTHEVSIRDGGIQSDYRALGASLSHQLGTGDRIGLSLSVEETGSDDPGRENIAKRAQLSYQLGKPLLGMALSGNLALEQRDYDFSVYDPSGRQDETISAGITAVFLNMSYFGFSPSLTLEASRTQSNVSLFDRESAGLRLGLQSTF